MERSNKEKRTWISWFDVSYGYQVDNKKLNKDLKRAVKFLPPLSLLLDVISPHCDILQSLIS